MRRFLIPLAGLALLVAACAPKISSPPPAAPASGQSCDAADLPTMKSGVLTVGTDNPAYPPWVIANTPENGKGYEPALTYALAEQLGFAKDDVKWVDVPFNKSYAPGPKNFDFDINNISITPERAKVVTFSDGYYDLTQALVAMKNKPIANAGTIEQLKPYKFGAQVGTTSLSFISTVIQPAQQPAVFDSTNDAKQALQNGQVDGLVLDLPTASYVSAFQIPGSKLVGQFPPSGEELGLLFQKDNPLVTCVNQALQTLKDDGTLQALQEKWLADYLAVPVIQ